MRYRLTLTVYYLDENGNELRDSKTFTRTKPFDAIQESKKWKETIKGRITTEASVGRWVK